MRPACLPGFCLDHLQCLRPGYLVCSRGHTAHRCALLQSPPREFIVFSMLEVTDNRLRARAPGVTGPDQSRRGSLGRVPPLLAHAYPHQRRGPLRCPALLPPVGGSSSAETLTELPRSSGQGHAPSRSSQPRDRGRSFRLLPSLSSPSNLAGFLSASLLPPASLLSCPLCPLTRVTARCVTRRFLTCLS